jgi:Plant transposon protein
MNFETLAAAAQAVINANNIAMEGAFLEGSITRLRAEEQEEEDHRQKPRTSRRVFWHDDALECIKRDYLGITGDPRTPLLGKEFPLMFRVSRGRFQCMMEDIAASTAAPFYLNRVNASKEEGPSFEARLLLPLKCLAYGVPPHSYIDYFQMSSTMARTCCREFDNAIKVCYLEEYLRVPTAGDLQSILKLHKSVHKVDGMFGSLDCSHTFWKNCPKAWKGSFQGKDKKPSIVLEAICDYHLFFWHASYGYAGTLNDKNILYLSPFLEPY